MIDGSTMRAAFCLLLLPIGRDINMEHRLCDEAAPSWALATQVGGRLTVLTFSAQSFTRSAPELSFADRTKATVGGLVFNRVWHDGTLLHQPISSGLGPKYISTSCTACHLRNGKGSIPNEQEDGLASMVLRLSVWQEGRAVAHPDYGGQLLTKATNGVEVDGSAELEWHERELALLDGSRIYLRRPIVRFVKSNRGVLDDGTVTSLRASPAVFGLGLLEAVSESDIIRASSANKYAESGISGRINWIWNQTAERYEVGRFGWKAAKSSVRSQIAGALLDDIGITNPSLQNESSQNGRRHVNPEGTVSEIDEREFGALVFYIQTLAVPARGDRPSPDVLQGARLFSDAHCTKCHTPILRTGSDHAIAELNNQMINPYTDLLLHDMGIDLADQRPESMATGREWRTPPLWGLGLAELVSGGEEHYLHDGRARTLSEAIMWHGGEGSISRDAFGAMDADERHALVVFLRSL